KFAVVVDARQPWPFDEIVGQDFPPQRHDLPGFGEEAVATDVEVEVLVAHGAADAAHISRVALDDDDGAPFLAEAIGCGQSGRPRADDQHLDVGHGSTRPPGSGSCATGGDAAAAKQYVRAAICVPWRPAVRQAPPLGGFA